MAKFLRYLSIGDSSFLDFFSSDIQRVLQSLDYRLDRNSFADFHKAVPLSDVNRVRLACYNSINKLDWIKHVQHFLLDSLKPLLGPDILIQKKINLSIQCPNDAASILASHSDIMSGDSIFEYVVWIPLTDAYETNSMFILDSDRSMHYLNGLRDSLPLSTGHIELVDFVNLKIGKLLIFSPTLIHGNVLNTTVHTRISLNFRVKNLFTPYQKWTPEDRKPGVYYDVLSMSESTKWNLQVYQLMNQ